MAIGCAFRILQNSRSSYQITKDTFLAVLIGRLMWAFKDGVTFKVKVKTRIFKNELVLQEHTNSLVVLLGRSLQVLYERKNSLIL